MNYNFLQVTVTYKVFPGGASGKEPVCKCGRCEFNPWMGRSPVGRPGNPLQCSCLENLMDRGTWKATVHRVTRSWTQLKQFSMLHINKS